MMYMYIEYSWFRTRAFLSVLMILHLLQRFTMPLKHYFKRIISSLERQLERAWASLIHWSEGPYFQYDSSQTFIQALTEDIGEGARRSVRYLVSNRRRAQRAEGRDPSNFIMKNLHTDLFLASKSNFDPTQGYEHSGSPSLDEAPKRWSPWKIFRKLKKKS
ncbi:hypothetical protein WG66_002335 [Moniliophthora roreri]|nr:hypothetical protein WG66_002335 [Moniliophthora roreri]